MCPSFKEECSCRNVWLGRFDKKEAFFEAQWRWPRLVFVVIRCLLSAYTLSTFIHMAVTLNQELPDSYDNFMVYLTNWTYLMETICFFWGAVMAFCFWFKHRKQEEPSPPGPAMVSLPWYVQVYWFLGNITQVMAIVVTFGAIHSWSKGITLIDLNAHGINSVMILIDVIIIARPVRFMHVLYPILYGLVYVIFSAIYWSQDHENNVLYHNLLDWNHPGPTFGVVAGVGLLGIPFLQLLHYGAYRLRLYCHLRIYGDSYL